MQTEQKIVPLNPTASILQSIRELVETPIDSHQLIEDARELRRNVLANPAHYPGIAMFYEEHYQEKIPDVQPPEDSL